MIIKILQIIILALFWSNITIAEIIELDQGVKIKIPYGYEYTQYNQYQYTKINLEGIEGISQSEIDDALDNLEKLLGMNGTETTTILGKKGYKNAYGELVNFALSGKNPETWSGFEKFARKCGSKLTEKSVMKCTIDFFKIDPIIQIDVANDTSEELKELASALDNPYVKKKKVFEKFNTAFGTGYKNEIETKITKIKNKIWGVEIKGEDITMGFTTKRIGYMFLHNERAFVIQGFCMSEKNCRKIKDLNDEILGPYISLKSIN